MKEPEQADGSKPELTLSTLRALGGIGDSGLRLKSLSTKFKDDKFSRSEILLRIDWKCREWFSMPVICVIMPINFLLLPLPNLHLY
jgi:hypothetical protein